MARWDQSDDREGAYYLGASDVLNLLEQQHIIDRTQLHAAWQDLPQHAVMMELAEELEEDDVE